jgi:Ras-related protein Rab-11A
LHLDNII